MKSKKEIEKRMNYYKRVLEKGGYKGIFKSIVELKIKLYEWVLDEN